MNEQNFNPEINSNLELIDQLMEIIGPVSEEEETDILEFIPAQELKQKINETKNLIEQDKENKEKHIDELKKWLEEKISAPYLQNA